MGLFVVGAREIDTNANDIYTPNHFKWAISILNMYATEMKFPNEQSRISVIITIDN